MVAKNTTRILKELRNLFMKDGYCKPYISAYVVGTADAHQSEYVADSDKRLPFLSGFTGSIGTAIVTKTEAAIWIDGKYYVQADEQVDSNWQVMKDGLSGVPTQAQWLGEKLEKGQSVGIYAELCTAKSYDAFEEEIHNFGLNLTPVLVDFVADISTLEEIPKRPSEPIIPLEIKYTGCSINDKVEKLRGILKKENVYGIVIEALDQVAYMFNLRGSDIQFNPVFFSYSIITLEHLFLFTDVKRITAEAADILESGKLCLKVLPYEEFEFAVKLIVDNYQGKIWIPSISSKKVTEFIPKERRVTLQSPIERMKAVKNEVEKKGMRECHIRDGVALCKYLALVESKVGQEGFTEISGATQLETFRAQQKDYMGLSFKSISAVGSNGAIVHYQPEKNTDKAIVDSEFYLIDSGGQYKDGTTDVTRTVHHGTPTDFQIECFTRVLKGVIAIATTVFPTKIPGNAIDAIARKALWDVGLDYGHGTGHGIGMFLNVHEGPIAITYKYRDDPGLEEGMFVSDEPGYYEDGKFGIRIENIVEIVKADTPYNHRNRGFLTFKTITMAPIQKSLIDVAMLTDAEIAWINNYHAEVFIKVGSVLQEIKDENTYNWLREQTSPL